MRYFLLLVLLSGCASVAPKAPNQVTFLYQSNRWGELEPCGCQSNPNGGLDREKNAVDRERARGTAFYVDAGNALASPSKKVTGEMKRKASTIVEILSTIGLDVLAPGPDDLKLGTRWLKSLAAGKKLKLVGTNSGFEPFVVIEKNGKKVAFLSATPKESALEDPKVALRRVIPEALKQTDFLVLLSQLGANADEALAEEFPTLRVIVGSDAKLSLEEPLWVGGHTLVVNPLVRGQALGKLEIESLSPFKGFYSDEVIRKNRLKLSAWESRKTKEADFLAARMRKFDNLSPVVGGSPYQGTLLTLDQKKYGDKNAVTDILKSVREKTTATALSE